MDSDDPWDEFFIGKIAQGLNQTGNQLSPKEREFLLTPVTELETTGFSPREGRALNTKCIAALSAAYTVDTAGRNPKAVQRWRENNEMLYTHSVAVVTGIVQNWYLSVGRNQEREAATRAGGGLRVIVLAILSLGSAFTGIGAAVAGKWWWALAGGSLFFLLAYLAYRSAAVNDPTRRAGPRRGDEMSRQLQYFAAEADARAEVRTEEGLREVDAIWGGLSERDQGLTLAAHLGVIDPPTHLSERVKRLRDDVRRMQQGEAEAAQLGLVVDDGMAALELVQRQPWFGDFVGQVRSQCAIGGADDIGRWGISRKKLAPYVYTCGFFFQTPADVRSGGAVTEWTWDVDLRAGTVSASSGTIDASGLTPDVLAALWDSQIHRIVAEIRTSDRAEHVHVRRLKLEVGPRLIHRAWAAKYVFLDVYLSAKADPASRARYMDGVADALIAIIGAEVQRTWNMSPTNWLNSAAAAIADHLRSKEQAHHPIPYSVSSGALAFGPEPQSDPVLAMTLGRALMDDLEQTYPAVLDAARAASAAS